jgi:hypothetical protein
MIYFSGKNNKKKKNSENNGWMYHLGGMSRKFVDFAVTSMIPVQINLLDIS